MYAIIRAGGKQTKVREGDVIDVESLRAEGEIPFTPLLLVDDAGTVFSGREVLKNTRVVARVMGESAGPKVELFKYKSKTGYRRHQGHRQRYTTLEVVRIDLPEGAMRNPPGAKPAEVAPAPAEPAVASRAAKPAAEVKAAGRKAKDRVAAPKTAASAKAPAKAAAKKTKKES